MLLNFCLEAEVFLKFFLKMSLSHVLNISLNFRNLSPNVLINMVFIKKNKKKVYLQVPDGGFKWINVYDKAWRHVAIYQCPGVRFLIAFNGWFRLKSSQMKEITSIFGRCVEISNYSERNTNLRLALTMKYHMTYYLPEVRKYVLILDKSATESNHGGAQVICRRGKFIAPPLLFLNQSRPWPWWRQFQRGLDYALIALLHHFNFPLLTMK